MLLAALFAPRKNSIDPRHRRKRRLGGSRNNGPRDCLRTNALIASFGISHLKSKTKMKMVLKIKKSVVRFIIHENRAKGNIMKTPLIKLTSNFEEMPVIVNAIFIVQISRATTASETTTIGLINGDHVYVMEKPDEIEKMIDEVMKL